MFVAAILAIGDQTTLTPVVRDVLKGTGLELTFSDAESFAAVKATLGGTGATALH